MGCILNYCSEKLSADMMVAAFYGTAVIVTIGLSFLANSRSLRAAASLIGGAWFLGLLSLLYLDVAGYYRVAIMLDAIIAYRFWRMAKVEIFAAPLCLILLFEIAIAIFAQAVGSSSYATMFALNRLFELTLIYLIGCSLFRIHILRRQQRSDRRIKGWRADFVLG